METVILGAGVTGLTCAREIQDALVLEQEDTIGGLARTCSHEGFRFDLGGHRFFSRNPGLSRYFSGLLGQELVTVNRRSKIYKNGRYLDYPLNLKFIFQENIFNPPVFLASYLWRKMIKKNNAHLFSGYMINHFGDSIYRRYFKDYTEKIWGISCDCLSADWARERIQGISLGSVARHLMTKGSRAKSFLDQFDYPQYGIGRLCEKLAEGTKIRLNAKVAGFKKQQAEIESVILASGENISCQRVVSTLPVTDLALMLNAPPPVCAAVAKLKYRSLIFVFLGFAKEQISKWHWVYIPGKEIFGRIHEPKNWSRLMAPAGKTGLCLEIFCSADDPLWRLDDDALVEICIQDLRFQNIGRVITRKVVRTKNAYPTYFCDYKENLKMVVDFLAQFKNLFLAGRTGRYAYLNMDDCMQEAITLAQNLKNKRFPDADAC